MTDRYLVLVQSMTARDQVSMILFVCASVLVVAAVLLRRTPLLYNVFVGCALAFMVFVMLYYGFKP